LRLVAVPHRIELRKEGYEPFRTTVTPRPGLEQTIEATLKTPEQIQAEATPPEILTAQEQKMVLVGGGRFRMGAPRREPGRRANETQHDVELTRPFYIAVHEVTNGEYREFDSEHNSGRAGGVSLDYDHHPVVRVTWEDAAAYCNWLSRRDSLPPAYVKRGGRLVVARPATTGYRLPTEAEWAFVSRYADGPTPLKYPWGGSLPIPPDSGNYGDQSAESLLDDSIAGYDDRYPATAPVDSFGPNSLGLHHLGGNVSEWVLDLYGVYPSRSGKTETDPLGPETGTDYVIRGGSWVDTMVSELRLSHRDHDDEGRSDVGFRIARYAE
jgi:formylglycine-generating enzyme required for sulfatase activity